MTGFDIDEFIRACCDTVAAESDPLPALRELLQRTLSDRSAVAAALPPTRAELTPLYLGPEVAVIKVVWAPGMTFPPHDHLTWACNGLYSGSEHNTLFECGDGDRLTSVGEFVIEEGGVATLTHDEIHAVRNPDPHRLSAAIHVYGGGFPELPRSNWVGDPPARVRADIELTRQMFERANEAM